VFICCRYTNSVPMVTGGFAMFVCFYKIFYSSNKIMGILGTLLRFAKSQQILTEYP
jgi:hypothetical protein